MTLLHRRGHHHTAQADDNHHSGVQCHFCGVCDDIVFFDKFLFILVTGTNCDFVKPDFQHTLHVS